MNFSCEKSTLQNAITAALRASSNRTSLPILSGAYIRAYEKQFSIEGTDLEIDILKSGEAEIDEEGGTVVTLKHLSEIVKNLADGKVVLESAEEGMILSSYKSRYSLRTFNEADWPELEGGSSLAEILIDQDYVGLVRRVVKATGREESRPVLIGVLHRISWIDEETAEIEVVASDAYRLSKGKITVKGKKFQEGEGEYLLPSRTVEEFIRFYSGDETKESKLVLKESAVEGNFAGTQIVSRLIQGNYPEYQRLYPNEFFLKAVVDTETLISALKRMSALLEGSPVKVHMQGNQLRLSGSAMMAGEGSEEIDIEKEGEDMEIAFNPNFLIEGLAVFETDKVMISMKSPKEPALLTNVESEKTNFSHLIMPVRSG